MRRDIDGEDVLGFLFSMVIFVFETLNHRLAVCLKH